MASLKVGDKVRIKTRKELLKAGFQPSQRDKDEILHRYGSRVLLWGSEAKLYCGEEAVVSEIRICEGVPVYEVHAVKDNDNKYIYNLDGDALERCEVEDYSFAKAVELLESKKCDAIKFAGNSVVGAYLKEGKLYKAIVEPFGDDSCVKYTDEAFEMYVEYATGKWTVHTDSSKRTYVRLAMKTINERLLGMLALGVLSEEEVQQIKNILQK